MKKYCSISLLSMKSCATEPRLLTCGLQLPSERGNHHELLEFEAHTEDCSAQPREIIFVRVPDALDKAMEPQAFQAGGNL